MTKCIGCNKNVVNPEVENEICNECMGYCASFIEADKCLCCGGNITDNDRLYDICNECVECSEYVITYDFDESKDPEEGVVYIDDEGEQYCECCICGELHPKEYMEEGMCGYCFNVNVG